MSGPIRHQRAELLRKIAEADIRRLSDELKQAVDRSLIYESGELVEIPSLREPVVMEIIERGQGYGEYRVRLLRDNTVITQQARYFQPHTPEG
jgi:hypothetical protein